MQHVLLCLQQPLRTHTGCLACCWERTQRGLTAGTTTVRGAQGLPCHLSGEDAVRTSAPTHPLPKRAPCHLNTLHCTHTSPVQRPAKAALPFVERRHCAHVCASLYAHATPPAHPAPGHCSPVQRRARAALTSVDHRHCAHACALNIRTPLSPPTHNPPP
jgi:hypothetical protein